MSNTAKRDYLWIVLFLIVFINGFEAGGYQASLWNIGKDFALSLISALVVIRMGRQESE